MYHGSLQKERTSRGTSERLKRKSGPPAPKVNPLRHCRGKREREKQGEHPYDERRCKTTLFESRVTFLPQRTVVRDGYPKISGDARSLMRARARASETLRSRCCAYQQPPINATKGRRTEYRNAGMCWSWKPPCAA